METKENEYKEMFLAEALDNYEELNQLFTDLEKDTNNQRAIDSIFRITHTLKGNAMGMGFTGIAELALALLIIPKSIRKWGAYGIIAMLVAFIPSHVYFIQIGSCIEGGLCAPEWVGWARLIVIHPILIYWAYKAK